MHAYGTLYQCRCTGTGAGGDRTSAVHEARRSSGTNGSRNTRAIIIKIRAVRGAILRFGILYVELYDSTGITYGITQYSACSCSTTRTVPYAHRTRLGFGNTGIRDAVWPAFGFGILGKFKSHMRMRSKYSKVPIIYRTGTGNANKCCVYCSG